MNDIQNKIKLHIQNIYKINEYDVYFTKKLENPLTNFINSINDDGSIPYMLNKKERYRASTLASSIVWLKYSNLIPCDVVSILQEKLIFLRDNHHEHDTYGSRSRAKYEGDEEGWSIAEGVSNWSTSMAIIALLIINETNKEHDEIIKKSTIWLTNQREEVNSTECAWSYQKFENCKKSIVMTSLVIQALALVLSHSRKNELFSENEKREISRSIKKGILFLTKSVNEKIFHSHWCFNDKPSCIATTWALLAIKYSLPICDNDNFKIFYNKHINKALRFVVDSMPSESIKWEDEDFVTEGQTKYKGTLSYSSFSSTLLIQLLYLGISPFNTSVVNQIYWLLNNTDEWKIEKYNKGEICTFTLAMTLSVIFKWLSSTGVLAKMLIYTENTISNKFRKNLIILVLDWKFSKKIIFKRFLKKISTKPLLFTIIFVILFLILFFLNINYSILIPIEQIKTQYNFVYDLVIAVCGTVFTAFLTKIFKKIIQKA